MVSYVFQKKKKNDHNSISYRIFTKCVLDNPPIEWWRLYSSPLNLGGPLELSPLVENSGSGAT